MRERECARGGTQGVRKYEDEDARPAARRTKRADVRQRINQAESSQVRRRQAVADTNATHKSALVLVYSNK